MNTTEYSPPGPFIEQLAGESSVWTRLAALRDTDGGWKESILELVTGQSPPRWEPIEWKYPTALFVAALVPGETVSAWLTSGIARVADTDVALPPVAQRASSTRHASKDFYLYEPLLWPSVMVEFTDNSLMEGSQHGELLADRAPAFLRFELAARYFLGLMDAQNPGLNSYRTPTLRFQDLSARVVSVRYDTREGKVEVQLEGNALEGLTVELAADVPGTSQRISPRHRDGLIVLSLDGPLPAGAWIAVRRGSELLDRRFLDRSRVSALSDDVQIIVEWRTAIQRLIASGESREVEFKEKVPVDPDARRKVARTVAAFANGRGGSILFGVTDEQQAIGVPIAGGRSDPQLDLSNWVRSLVDPRPECEVIAVKLEDVTGQPNSDDLGVIMLRVVPGNSRPYTAGDPAIVYVRHSSSTAPASSSEIRQLAQGGTSWTSIDPYSI